MSGQNPYSQGPNQESGYGGGGYGQVSRIVAARAVVIRVLQSIEPTMLTKIAPGS